MGVNQRQNRTFAVIFDYKSDVLLIFQFFFEIIGHAAGYHHNGILIFSGSLANYGSRFLIALIGYRTGIYDHHIWRFVKINQLIASLIKISNQSIGFVLIETAT